MTLEVRVTNTGAQELYRRFGFAPAGIRKNYYADVNEDAIVMWAHDVETDEYAVRLAGIERYLEAQGRRAPREARAAVPASAAPIKPTRTGVSSSDAHR